MGVVNVSWPWDNRNRLSTVTDHRLGGANNVTTYTYDNASNVVTVTYPNGQQATFQYDQENRLTGLSSQPASYTYQRGPTGNLLSASESSGRQASWSFDGIYRLTGETVANDPSKVNGTVGYSLDPVGNRLQQSSSLSGVSSLSFSYNANDELTGEMYDANGNVTETGGKSFTYDSQNELVSMNGGAVTIQYDGDGNRATETASGSTTRYLVDDLNPTGYPQVVEETVNGAPQREYTYGLQRIDEDQIVSNAWTASYYGYDGFGTVRQLTNAAGAVTDTWEYDAFGNEIDHTGSTPNNYLYRGEAYDSNLSLYYLRARWMNPLTGRFMSRDPLDGLVWVPKTLHKYLYVGSDPVNNVDPSGRDLFEYAIESNAAIPEARLIDIYGCVADASLTAVDLIINPTPNTSTALGGGATVIGCVLLSPGLSDFAETGSTITKRTLGAIKLVGNTADWGSCALDLEEIFNGFNDVLSGAPDGIQITNSITALTGCVGNALDYLLTHPGASLQDLGLQ